MSSTEIISAILSLLSGIGIFLVSCKMMSSNLESLNSASLRKLFFKTSKNKWFGVGVGIAFTALIQSSGATSVMVTGFVNSKIMDLTSAVAIIFGANIGTTVTGQIVSLGLYGNTISTTIIFSAFAGVGAAITMFSSKEKTKRIAEIVTGFGMIFAGLGMMSSSMKSFAQVPAVLLFLSSLQNVFLLVIVGAIFTAIVQSSSVITSVVITMASAGLLTLKQGIYITVGSNIGACVVVLIAGFSGNANSKRTALAALWFNIFGAIIFLFLDYILELISRGNVSFTYITELLVPAAVQTRLAMFHTFYNVGKTLIALPFTKALIRFSSSMISDDKVSEEKFRFHYIDNNLLRTPAIAARQVKNEVLNMGAMALENFNISLDMITTLNFDKAEEFKNREEELDSLNKTITGFVVELLKCNHSEYDRKYLSSTFRSVADFERIGDYSENIVEYAENLRKDNCKFSKEATEEIEKVRSLVNDLYSKIVIAYRDKSKDFLNQAYEIEDMVDDITDRMQENHISRLNKGICSATTGAQYLSFAEDSERVADHLINVGNTIKTLV